MSNFRIFLAVIIPLCQASPLGYYMSKDFEPPAYRECPGPRDGYYMDPYGNCGVYVECMYVGTSMEMAWVMPCIPGSQFQYPSVCEQCGKRNANDDKINARVVPPRVSSEHNDGFDKSTPTTILTPTTPSMRPSRQPSSKQQPLTLKLRMAEQTTVAETTTEGGEKTTAGRSPQEEVSTHLFTQTSGHKVRENEVTTTALPGTTNTDKEETTLSDTQSPVVHNVHVTSSEAKNTNDNLATTIAKMSTEEAVHITKKATTGADVPITKKPTTERQGTEGTSSKTEAKTTPSPKRSSIKTRKETTITDMPETKTSTRGTTQSHEAYETTATQAVMSDGDFTTDARPESHSNRPRVRISSESVSDLPRVTGSPNASVQQPDKGIDSSRANFIEVTSNIIKSALLSDLSDLSELKTTSSDLEQFTTSSPNPSSKDEDQS